MGMISKLEAINRMLLNSGEQMVTGLEDEQAVYLTIAKYVFNETVRDYQLRGILHNKDIKKFFHGSVISIGLPTTTTTNTAILDSGSASRFTFDTGLEIDVKFTANTIASDGLILSSFGKNWIKQIKEGDSGHDAVSNMFGTTTTSDAVKVKTLNGTETGITADVAYLMGVCESFSIDPQYSGSGFTTGDIVRIKPVAATFGAHSNHGGTYNFETPLISGAGRWIWDSVSAANTTSNTSCWGAEEYNAGGVQCVVTASDGALKFFEDGSASTAPQKTNSSVLLDTSTSVTNATNNFWNISTTNTKSYPGANYDAKKVSNQSIEYLSGSGTGKNARVNLTLSDGVVKTLGDFKDRGKLNSAGTYVLFPPYQSSYADLSSTSRSTVTTTIKNNVLPPDIESDSNTSLCLEDAGELDSDKFTAGTWYTFDAAVAQLDGTSRNYTLPTSYTGDDGNSYHCQIQGYVNTKVLNPTIFNYQISKNLTSDGTAAYTATGFLGTILTSTTASSAGAKCKVKFIEIADKIIDVQLVDGGYGWETGDVITFDFPDATSVPAKTSTAQKKKSFSYTIAASDHKSGRSIVSALGIQKIKTMPASSDYRGEGLWHGGTTNDDVGSIGHLNALGLKNMVGATGGSYGFDYGTGSAGRQLYYIVWDTGTDVKNAIVQGLEDSDGNVDIECIVDSGYGYEKEAATGTAHSFKLERVTGGVESVALTINLGYIDADVTSTTHGSAGAPISTRAITGPLLKMKREITSTNKNTVADPSYPTSGALSAESNFAPSFFFYTKDGNSTYNAADDETLYTGVVETATLVHNGANYAASTTQEYEINDTSAGTAASVSFTFSEGCDLAATIQLISTDGTTKTYEASSSANGTVLANDNIAFAVDGSPTHAEMATALKAAIDHSNGHGTSRFTVAISGASSNVLTITQVARGTAGNTTITVGGGFNDHISGSVASAFTSGVDARASLYISEVLNGVISDFSFVNPGTGYVVGDVLTVKSPASSTIPVVFRAAEVTDGAISGLTLRYKDKTDHVGSDAFTSYGWGYSNEMVDDDTNYPTVTTNLTEFAVTQTVSATGSPVIQDGTNFNVRGTVGGDANPIVSGLVYAVNDQQDDTSDIITKGMRVKLDSDTTAITRSYVSSVFDITKVSNVQPSEVTLVSSGQKYSTNDTVSVSYTDKAGTTASYSLPINLASDKIILQENAEIFDLETGPTSKTILSARYINGYDEGDYEYDADNILIDGADYFNQSEKKIYLKNLTNDTLSWDTTKVTDGRNVEVIYFIPWEAIDTAMQTSIIDTAVREYQRITVGDLNVDSLLAQREMETKLNAKAKDITDHNKNILTTGDPNVYKAVYRNRNRGYNDAWVRRQWRGLPDG